MSIFPLREAVSRSGLAFLSWAILRRLLVPTRAPSGNSSSLSPTREIRASRGSSRSGKMVTSSPSGSSAGTSFKLCTAKSASFLRRASSISFTKRPLPPTWASGTSRILSPLVVNFTRSTLTSGQCVSISFLTQLLCARANTLFLVPSRNFFPIPTSTPAGAAVGTCATVTEAA